MLLCNNIVLPVFFNYMLKLNFLNFFLFISCAFILKSQDEKPFLIDFGDEHVTDEQIGTLTRGINHFQMYLSPGQTINDKRSELLINTVNGNVFYRRNDILIHGAPFPISVSFSYNSTSSFKGRYGYKWQFSYNIQYVANNFNSNLIIHLSDGKTELYIAQDSVYIPFYGAEGKLKFKDTALYYQANSMKSLQIEKPLDLKFGGVGHNYITRISDMFGNAIELEYISKRLSRVIFPNNGTLELSYEKELLAEINYSNAYKINFKYDESENLIEVNHPSDETYKYEYDTECNLLTKIIYPDGRHVKIDYDNNLAVSGLLINDSLQYTFDLNLQSDSFDAKLPNDWTYSFLSDSLFRTIAKSDPAGNITEYQYDLNNRLIAIERPGEATTRYFYNDDGLMIIKIDPLNRQSSYSYSKLGLIESYTDAENNTWNILRDFYGKIKEIASVSYSYRYSFDESNRLTTFSFGDSKFHFENDKQRNLLRISFDRDIIYDFRFDKFSKLTSLTKPDRSLYLFDYDKTGNMIAISYPNGSIRKFEYDKSGRILTLTERDNTKFTFGYDYAGRFNSYTLANTLYFSIKYGSFGNFSIFRGTQVLGDYHYGKNFKLTGLLSAYHQSFDYDERDNLIVHKIENDIFKQQRFNLNDELIERNQGGSVQTFRYDKMSRPVSIASAIGRYEYTWDELSNLKQVLAPHNLGFYIKYNLFSQPESILRQNSSFITYGYDKIGNLILINKSGGDNITQNYDISGNLIRTTKNNLVPVNYTYDLGGLIKTINNGLMSLEYDYDNCDRITTIVRNGKSFKQYSYNNIGKVSDIISYNAKTSYTYDNLGKLNSVTNNGLTHRFNHFPRSLVVSYFNAFNYQYSYNERGLLSTITNPDNDELRLIYNSNFRLNEIFLDNDNRFKIEYTGGSLLSSMIDGTDRRFNFYYTNSGRLLSITDPNFNSTGIIHDIYGNITSYSLPGNATISLSYDKDRIEKIIFPGNDSLKYSYNQYGDLISITNEKNNTTYYQYNTFGKLSKVGDNSLSQYFYYDDNLRTSKIVLNYDSLKFLYDDNKVIGITLNDLKFDLQYTNDRLNSISINSKPIVTITYDDFGLLASFTNNFGFKETYQNSHIGLINKVTDFINNDIDKFYDKLGRILTIRYSHGSLERFGYTKNGLLESFRNRDFSEFFVRYNKSNLPIKFIINRFDSLTFNYNSSGDIVEIINPSGTANKFLYNTLGQLSAYIAPNSSSINFLYSKSANEIKVFTTIGDTTSYGLDRYNRIVYMRDKSGRTFLNNRGHTGTLFSKTINSDTTYSINYDKNFRTTEIKKHDLIHSFEYDLTNFAPKSILLNGTKYTFSLSGNSINLYQQNHLNSTINFDGKLLPRKLDFPRIGNYYYTYDENFNLSQQIDDIIHPNTFQFSPYGNILGFMRNTILFPFEYDIKSNLVKSTSPMIDYSFFYDNNNNLIIAGLPTSFELNFDYNTADRLKTRTDQSGSINYYEYNKMGKTERYSNPSLFVNEITLEYDLADRVKTQNTKYEQSVNKAIFSYEPLNRLDQIIYKDKIYLEVKRNKFQRIDTSYSASGIKIISKYDEFHRLVSLEYPNNISISYEYGIFNKVSKITVKQASIIQEVYNYEYDNLGRLITVKSNNDSIVFKATYTSRHQYKSFESENGKMNFTYNSGARLVSLTENEISRSIGYGAYSIFPIRIGSHKITSTSKGNVTSISKDNNETLYYYDNESKLIGMIDTTGVYTSFHYNPLGKLVRIISTDTIDLEYVKFRDNDLFYPQINVNGLKKATYYYQELFDAMIPLSAKIDGTTFTFIEDEFGNRLGYIASDSLILEPRFDYFDFSSPNEFIPTRRFIPIVGTNLKYDGDNFYNADLGMYITNNNNKFGYSSPFLEPICTSDKDEKFTNQVSYQIDSKLIIGGSERHSKHIDKILDGNILSNLVKNEINTQFNNFLTFKVSADVKEPKAKYPLLMPNDILQVLYLDIINAPCNRNIELMPEGISYLSDTVFQKAYQGINIDKLINLPKQNSSNLENILEILKYLDYSGDDQLVRVLNLIRRILNIGEIILPSNVIDISPINASLGFVDSVLKAEDYVHKIITSSQEISPVQQSIDNVIKVLEQYKNSLKPPTKQDNCIAVDILSPTIKSYKPNYIYTDYTPSIYYDFMDVQYSNFSRIFSVISNYNKPFRLLPSLNYDSNIVLPIYFDTLDDINLKYLRPVFKNYFDFLR